MTMINKPRKTSRRNGPAKSPAQIRARKLNFAVFRLKGMQASLGAIADDGCADECSQAIIATIDRKLSHLIVRIKAT